MTDRPSSGRGGAPTEVRLVVWQFVRVMVQLETVARARGRQGAPSIYGAWRPAWQELDRRLTQLGKTDAAGFSDLMMEQEVVLQCRNRAQFNELTRTVDNVINQLKGEIKAAAGDARRLTDLRFERTELETLSRHLRKLAKSGSRGEPRTKTPRAKAPPPGKTPPRGRPKNKPPGRSTGKATGRRSASR